MDITEWVEVLEWCGLPRTKTGYWLMPDGHAYIKTPPLNLTNLFKYVTPELYKRGLYYELMQWDEGQHKAIINEKTPEWTMTVSDAIDKDPEMALLRAVLQIMKEK